MKVAAIGDKNFTLAWKLVGAEAFEVKSDEEFSKIFRNVLRSGGYSATIIPERFLDAANKVRSELQVEEKIEPMLAVVPERGLGKRIEDLKKRINLAIGVEVQI